MHWKYLKSVTAEVVKFAEQARLSVRSDDRLSALSLRHKKE